MLNLAISHCITTDKASQKKLHSILKVAAMAPLRTHVESIKDTIFQITFSSEAHKVELDKQSVAGDDEAGGCSLVSSKSFGDFDRSYVHSPISPIVQDSVPAAQGSSADPFKDDVEGKGEEKEPKQQQQRSTSIKPGYRKFIGLFLALLATFIYSIATLVVKLLRDYHPFTISVWRFQGFIIPAIPTILYHKYSKKQPVFGSILPLTKKGNWKTVLLIFLRSVVGCSSSILQIYAVQMINMADASVIVFSSPVFVTIVAHIFLRERAGAFSIICALFTFAGVVIIARPPMLTGESLDDTTLLGSAMALGSMLLATLVYIILRFLREIHYSVVTLSYGILGSIESIILALVVGAFEFPKDMWEWILAFALILFTYAGQTALILALKFEEAGPVSLIQTTDVVFAFLWQLIFLGVYPDMYSIIGAAIVIFGVTAISLRKFMINLPEDHPTRVRFSFCLK